MKLKQKILFAQYASCTCMTKTPELQYHEEGCRYRVLGEAQHRIDILESALRWYATGYHMLIDTSSWDTVSGELPSYWCDEAGTATIEDGTLAKKFLLGELTDWGDDEIPELLPEEQTEIG